VHDTADDAAIIRSLNTTDIRRQVRLDPIPLFIAQPKKVLAHDPDPQNESVPHGIRIALPPHQN
jgi:hypothetical protein